MNVYALKFCTLVLSLIVLATSSQLLLAQDKFVGELTILEDTAGFVTVNGERAVSGRSITSPSKIVTTAPAGARVTLPETGTILIAPNSEVNLSFIKSSISGEVTRGEVTIETAPNVTINLLTADGSITVPEPAQNNIFKIKIENGITRVNTLVGKVNFNNIAIPAGEFYPALPAGQTPDTKAQGGSGGSTALILLGVLGAVGAAAILALAGNSGSGSPPVVSPNR